MASTMERGAVSPVIAVAGEAADARAIPAHHQPIAIVLYFMNPQRAGRWLLRLRRQAWFDKAEGTPHGHSRRLGQRRFNTVQERQNLNAPNGLPLVTHQPLHSASLRAVVFHPSPMLPHGRLLSSWPWMAGRRPFAGHRCRLAGAGWSLGWWLVDDGLVCP